MVKKLTVNANDNIEDAIVERTLAEVNLRN